MRNLTKSRVMLKTMISRFLCLNGQMAMKDKDAAATHFLRALEKIPEYISQYKHRIESMERDLKQMMPAINKE